MKRANQDISSQYEVVPVDLGSGDAKIFENLAALLIISPQTKFSDTAKYQIDQYIMRGGKVAFLLNKMNASFQARSQYERPSAQPIDLGLEDMLENYGIRINADLVRDRQCANITLVQQQGPFQMQSQIPFPYLLNAVNVDRTNPIVKDLQGLILYFASSLDTTLAANKGLKAEVLVRSSKRSGRQNGYMTIDPYCFDREVYNESNIPLAVVLSGSFKSYFEGKSIVPQAIKSPDTRIIVVGDGDFMKDDFAGNRGNPIFFTNIVDYLADDAGLITIRSKNVTPPPMEQISDGTKKLLKYGNFLLPPLLVIGYGLLRWRRRTALKRSLESQI
jgi:ABC-2 type transport system permease protein